MFKLKDYNSYEESYEKTDSSVVDSYLYDSLTLTLIVKFANGMKYMYSGVPNTTYNNFVISESKGNFVQKRLKGYPYKKLSHEE